MTRFFMLTLSFVSLFMMGCSHYGSKKSSCKDKMSSRHNEKMWAKLDTDSDGFITRKEFDSMHGDTFTQMDANKDGKISKEEGMSFHKNKMGAKKKKGCCK